MPDTRHPLRVIWITTICTALSLFGDATMYSVLPSQYRVVGITVLQVGWLLSINRLVRLPLNVPSGWLSARFGPKWPYVAGLTFGFLSTLGYGLTKGFWLLLVCRALWGVAWALLAVAAYGMVLDVSTERTRGRYTGTYASFSYFGGAVGGLLGCILVDSLGVSTAMLILGGCASLACFAALTLPHTQHMRSDAMPVAVGAPAAAGAPSPRSSARVPTWWQSVRRLDARVWLIISLNFAHRMFFAGVFYSTLGLYLRNNLGDALRLGPLLIGVASLTGTLLFARNVVTILVGPSMGYLSDRLGDRRRVLLLGEIVGILGLGSFALGGSPWLLGLGIFLIASADGLVPPMLVAWIGDLSKDGGRDVIVGGYQTMGDLGSGLGPLIAYPLVALLGMRSVYGMAALLLALTIPFILRSRR